MYNTQIGPGLLEKRSVQPVEQPTLNSGQPVDRTMPVGKPKASAEANPWAGTGYDPLNPVAQGAEGDLDFAVKGLQYAAQQKYGKQLDQNQLNQIAAQAGYKGGKVNADMYNKALGYLPTIFGAAGQPVQPTQPVTQPGMGPGGSQQNVGPGAAANQYQQQQMQVAGVPPAFAQANPYQQQQQQMMQQILMNPATMGQKQQDQLMERQKEAAASMAQQLGQQAQRAGASRGFAANPAQQQALQQQMMAQILSGGRDVALQASQQNRQDQYNALNASSQLANQGFQNDLQRAGMGLGQINQNRQLGLQEYLGEHGVGLDNRRFTQQQQEFAKTFGLDFLRYMAQKDQFNRQLNQQGQQFNDQMGLNWNQNLFNQQKSFLDYISGL